jgi:hypothetical protein
MTAAFFFAGLTTFGIGQILLVIAIFAFLAWRVRRNMVIVLGALSVILVCSGFLTIDSWERADSFLTAVGTVVFAVALVVLGVTIYRLLGGIGKRPARSPRHSG